MSQIGLPFDWQAQIQAGSFLRSEANRLAFRHMQAWQYWPVPVSILIGPPRSGKTTLGCHFSDISGGVVIDEAQEKDEQMLFHQWNIARDSGRPLLMITPKQPTEWGVALPDLRSRLAGAIHVEIEAPDEILTRQIIETGLSQAGTAFASDVPEWLARRTQADYGAIADMLLEVNRLSLAQSRRISVALLKETALPFVDENIPSGAHP